MTDSDICLAVVFFNLGVTDTEEIREALDWDLRTASTVEGLLADFDVTESDHITFDRAFEIERGTEY